MFYDILEFIARLIIVIVLFVWGCYWGYVNTKPKEIKDTKCIYYEKQIYCLQENEGEE